MPDKSQESPLPSCPVCGCPEHKADSGKSAWLYWKCGAWQHEHGTFGVHGMDQERRHWRIAIVAVRDSKAVSA